ncbi:DUF2325 domain-containing protein [Bacillus subtilis]|uniref:DUF2325 domain-containing protein n=1 Tax=Bacillus subtilis TaxID=1423 RepID=UPI00202622E4|nr:DUF2325 domain-containing protein [Bacillus subtilis]MCL9628305.1 DUF2325 domain-containing protein [Bacillus subtilis]
MQKDRVFSSAIDDMVSVLREADFGNLKETEEKINQYFNLLRVLHSPLVLSDGGKEENYPDKNEDVKGIHDSDSEIAEKEETQSNVNSYVLERKLNGGWLNEINRFVPEKYIRKLDLGDGDRISAEYIGNERFHFELVEKNEDANRRCKRREIKYGVVKKVGDRYLVEEQLIDGGIKNIKVNGDLCSFLLTDFHLNEFGDDLEIEDGTIVDIAYWDGDVTTFKIVWVHPTDTIEYKKPKPSGYYKQTENKPKEDMTNDLKGKTVLLICGEGTDDSFRVAVESMGGNFVMLDAGKPESKEFMSRMESKIKQADYVVIMETRLSHNKSTRAAKCCKDFNIKFDYLKGNGVGSFTNLIKEMVDQQPVLT